jgi:hypothetical protein
MASIEFDEQPALAYELLEKTGDLTLLDAIDAALDILEDDPGGAEARRRSFGDGRWGIPVRTRTDDWLVIWEHDGDVPVVRYLGADPFA